MQLTFTRLLMVLLLSTSHLTLFAQKVNLSFNNQRMDIVLAEIRKQTKFDLLGDLNLINKSKPVTIHVKAIDVAQVLKTLSINEPFTLSLVDNTIVLKPNEAKNTSVMSLPLKAQDDYELTGFINKEEGGALAGATIENLTKKKTAQTDAKGFFTLQVSAADLLEVRMVGYSSKQVEVQGRKTLTIVLQVKIETMNDVVINGYYSRKKESMTGASTTITRKELEKNNNNNIFAIIQNIDPAFKLGERTVNGSNPNALPDISIRGTNSVGEYAVNAPLIIMDGFEVPIDRLYDLDVNRIESISILKDASSTILYGSRGGNGVVVIETRLPKEGKFTVTYEAKPSLTAVDLSAYHLMNGAEKLAYEKLAGIYTSTSTDIAYRERQQAVMDNIYTSRYLNVLGGVNTDWISQPVETNLSVAHSIRLEGGNGMVRYSIDGNYNDFKGAMKESGRRRAGAGFNLIYRIPNKITLRNYASFQSTNAYNSPYGKFNLYTQLNPYEKIYDENGELIVTYNDKFVESSRSLAYNPLYNASLSSRDYTNNTVINNAVSLEWFINKNFNFRAKGIVEKSFLDGAYYQSPKHTNFTGQPVALSGLYNLSNGKGFSYYFNSQLTYTQNIGKHALNATLIGELKDNNNQLTGYSLVGFADDQYISPSFALQFKPNSIPTYSNVPSRLIGTVLTGNYTYDSKYILEASYRIDGSSKFGANNRFSSFWSTGLGYNLHNEQFMKGGFFSLLKLYANVGVNGSDNFSADMTSTSYTIDADNLYHQLIGLGYANEGNSDLSWPLIKSVSAGVDSKFWDGRINFNVAVYQKTTSRMIAKISVAPSLGIPGNAYFENLGKTQNIGFESSVNIRVYQHPANEIAWYVGGSAVRNNSKLLQISDALKALNNANNIADANGIYKQSVYYQEGESLNNIKGVRSLGIDPNSGREVFLTKSGQVTYNWNANDIVIIGNTEPKLFGTVNTAFNYKRFNVQAYFNYALGGDIYNQTLVNKVENVNPKYNADVRVLEDRWKKPGDLAQFKAITDQTKTLLSSRFAQAENYLQFSSLNINYDFGRKLLSKYKLERLRLNLSMNDIWRMSTVSMERGTDYPFARTLNFGLMIQF